MEYGFWKQFQFLIFGIQCARSLHNLSHSQQHFMPPLLGKTSTETGRVHENSIQLETGIFVQVQQAYAFFVAFVSVGLGDSVSSS